jgi:hypothetical protein
VQVLTPGVYTATASYTSKLQATFRLSVGSYASIKAGSARALTVQWPAQVSGLFRLLFFCKFVPGETQHRVRLSVGSYVVCACSWDPAQI